eukprot:GHVU01113886.1.p1 GENE.GHVU01113886.1~~GHVU01113886.1.p1  ORF type:complete len:125 (-),score=8.30 GHVU01113886.1:295-669(-)
MLCFATLSYMFRVYNSFNALTLCTLNAPPLPLTTPNILKTLYRTQSYEIYNFHLSTGRRLCQHMSAYFILFILLFFPFPLLLLFLLLFLGASLFLSGCEQPHELLEQVQPKILEQATSSLKDCE